MLRKQVLAAPLVQVKALVAALPLMLKVLAVAGSTPAIHTFEASLFAAVDLVNVWLIFRPGQYEVLCPAEGAKSLCRL